jgi:putative ABC transport system permease protein
VALGQPLSQEDLDEEASKLLIGQTVREQLFGPEDPVGELVRMNGQIYEVAGVLAPKGQNADGRDQDDWVMLPHTTAQSKLRGRSRGIPYLDDILCSARAPEAVNPAIDRVIALLRERHHIAPGMEDDFNIRRPDEVVKAQLAASQALELLLISVASISLLVGGIGIMNVMLASVVQRTREIGLRLAVGARQSAVQWQFLGEAVILTLAGGVLGVLLSLAAAPLMARVLDWRLTIPTNALALAVISSVAVGVFFGFYPARLAAGLDPIEALRHE